MKTLCLSRGALYECDVCFSGKPVQSETEHELYIGILWINVHSVKKIKLNKYHLLPSAMQDQPSPQHLKLYSLCLQKNKYMPCMYRAEMEGTSNNWRFLQQSWWLWFFDVMRHKYSNMVRSASELTTSNVSFPRIKYCLQLPQTR